MLEHSVQGVPVSRVLSFIPHFSSPSHRLHRPRW
ncbi:hypothetical protein CCHR01_10365 [Colletotrichum chrysophilum]|uniref:Uncharacterized protein n=1 Tax=Colletotrichum chrysophilum TaxID=1836956 RepID=A0AAD9AF46_9PEZI|nr:hypothetical protein CCHR01_10365 [Colletotrichum chrysophilum]